MRLLKTFNGGLLAGNLAKQFDGSGEPSEIIGFYDEGEQWVSGIETDTHTYICEGFGAHNSVAEHSIRCSVNVPEAYALAALMHDASEAYIADVLRPIKPYLIGYKDIESNVMAVIAKKYGFQWPLPAIVKHIDNVMLYTEKRDLLGTSPMEWSDTTTKPLAEVIIPMKDNVREIFLARFHYLTQKK